MHALYYINICIKNYPTDPLRFGNFETSILPISHSNILLTGSNEYFPWFGIRVQFKTIFGIGISRVTFSTYNLVIN